MMLPTKNGRNFLWLVWALVLVPFPRWGSLVRIYVTNSAGDSVHVIDPATNKVVQVIKGIEAAHGINFSPDGARVYISNEAENTLDVVDRKSGRIVKKVALSGHPNNIAVTKDGKRVVVAVAEEAGALDFIDTISLTRAKTIPVNGRQHNVYVTPDGKYSVSGSTRSNVISVVDLQTEQPAWELKLDAGIRPMTFDVGPDGSTRRIFAQLSNLNGFAVVDFAGRKEIEKSSFRTNPPGMAHRSNAWGRLLTASASRRTEGPSGLPASWPTLFLFTRFPISSFRETSRCLSSSSSNSRNRSARCQIGSPSHLTAS